MYGSAYGKSVCPERRRSVVSTGERRRTPLGFDSGRSKRIMREPVLRQGILVHNCEGIEIVINERKKRMYLPV